MKKTKLKLLNTHQFSCGVTELNYMVDEQYYVANMKHFFIFLVAILLFSCASQTGLNNALQGTWAPVEDENVAFTIEGNTIQYFEEESLLDVRLEGNTLSIIEEGHELGKWQVLKADKETLVLKSEDGSVHKYVKLR
jgi:hypothetical protein